MNEKHTSEPWRDSDEILDAGELIFDPSCHPIYNNQGLMIGITFSRKDARLIAAAPKLLEALQSISECCDEDHAARDYASRQTEIRGIARAAIAKATGQ